MFRKGRRKEQLKRTQSSRKRICSTLKEYGELLRTSYLKGGTLLKVVVPNRKNVQLGRKIAMVSFTKSNLIDTYFLPTNSTQVHEGLFGGLFPVSKSDLFLLL